MSQEIVILGGGPAGLTAAYQLSKEGMHTTVVEKDEVIGGLTRTVSYKGFRFDIGGHRFFTKIPEVHDIWQELLGEELLIRPRLSRIYYRGRFFHYPLKPLEAVFGLGPMEVLPVLFSYLWAQVFPSKEEVNFEQWVSNRFGHRLYSIFFKTYTEKVWGMPCAEIGAEWAVQRIQNLSLGSAIHRALFPSPGSSTIRTLVDRFEYPRLGPGQMWERCREIIEGRGHPVLMGRRVTSIRHASGQVVSLTVRDAEGCVEEFPATHLISSIPLSDLIQVLDPAPPTEVIAAARRLRYRDYLSVDLVVDRPELFPDNWIYIHAPEVRLGRIQNFRNWSADMVADPDKSGLGLEYFVFEGDDLWSMADDQLLELGARELEQIGILSRREVSDGLVVRMPKAYPVYDAHYKEALATIRPYLETLSNLHTVGRNGQHRYNNQDHSMLTAMLAVRNVLGEWHDVWNVNLGPEYHETLERAQPQRLSPRLTRPVRRKRSPSAVP